MTKTRKIDIDEKYMRLAINLAKKAEGMTSPNPIVGAVVVKDKAVVGRGYHKKAGLPHAEINALAQARSAAEGATLYVTLEPCDHFGRTPPCAAAIVRAGIKRVVIGMADPNPINNGKGIRKLKNRGIDTTVGVLEDEAGALNRPYLKFITKGLPYVTIKMAQSLDGKIATRTGDSRWISCEESRAYVQKLRGRVDAVMVGVNTVMEDDPLLLSRLPVCGRTTARQTSLPATRQPIRVIVDSRLRTPLKARIFTDIGKSPVVIAAAKETPKAELYRRRGAQVLIARRKDGKVDLRKLLKALAKRGVVHILAEGGGGLAAGLIEEGLADRFLFFVAPKIIGGKAALTSVEGWGVAKVSGAVGLKNLKMRRSGEDILIEADA